MHHPITHYSNTHTQKTVTDVQQKLKEIFSCANLS